VRKHWAAVLAVVLAPVVAWVLCSTGVVKVAGSRPQPREYAVFERVAWLPAGEEKGEIGYASRAGGATAVCPLAFWILDDGTIRVLDSAKNRVVDFRESTFVREIPLPGRGEAMDMVVGSDGTIYVWKTSAKPCVLALDEDGRVVDEWPIPQDIAWQVLYLHPRERGEPLIVCAELGEAELDSLRYGGNWAPRFSHLGVTRVYRFRRSEARVERAAPAVEITGGGSVTSVEPWRIDALGNMYVSYLDLARTGPFNGDHVICKFSPGGKLLGLACFPGYGGLWSWTRRWMFVSEVGSIFLLRALQYGVSIERVHLGRRYDSVIEEVETQGRVIDKAYRRPKFSYVSTSTILEVPLGTGSEELGVELRGGTPAGLPAACAVAGDQVLVLDTLKRRVVVCRRGVVERTVPIPGISDGRSIAVGRDGDWYLYDAADGRVVRVSPAGRVKREWPVPERVRTGDPVLRVARGGEVVLAVGELEYGLERLSSRPAPGVGFPGRALRYTVRRLGWRTASVCVGGRERWRLATKGELADVTLLGYDRRGCLIASAWEIFPDGRLRLLFALHDDGTVKRNLLPTWNFVQSPRNDLLVGADGRVYILGFTRDRAVVQRLSF